jgi:amino acid transporter
MAQQPEEKSAAARFGTFGGVFTPCTLTILGVIMFLRFGEVVGNAGILHAILIVLSAKLITTLTALSLSAIATNTPVKGGGAYYLISRSLGIEFGGAIGVVFYISQAIAVALYVIGFTEALLAVVPAFAVAPRLVATVVNVVVFVCVFIGAGWTIKIQYGILGLLMLAIASFVAGAVRAWDATLLSANWTSSYATGEHYWTMFALFFPAVTGIMAGTNMSGDLKDPGRAIPRGTLLAILFTGIVYISFAFLLGGAVPRADLLADSMIVSKRALVSLLIILGVLSATLSSALGSMMGAPRILQALARDRVLPLLGFFAKGSGDTGEPRRATILSFAIAQAGVMLGDLNAIAPVITMFFMITYGAINLATFFEGFSGNPSYRPTFRWCHWLVSLAGALFCGAVMLLISPFWAIMAVITMSAIYLTLRHQQLTTSWGDVVSGAIFERVRRNLLALQQSEYHIKNWRPAILVLGGSSRERLYIAAMGQRLAGKHGLLMLGNVLVGSPDELLDRHGSVQLALKKLVADNNLEAFPVVTIAPRLTEGISSLIQCCGLGALRPNMVLFGWNTDPERDAIYEEDMRTVARLGRSMAVFYSHQPPQDIWALRPGSIDIWWQGKGSNGHLMLLLAHLLCSDPDMRRHRIRIVRMLKSEAGREETLAHLHELSEDVRIPCDPVVVIDNDFSSVLHRESANAALVILGLPDPREQEEGMLEQMKAQITGLPNVLFVYSAGDMSLHA